MATAQMAARSSTEKSSFRYVRIAFVSTMSAASWGGSEVLWARTAMEAISQGHTVYASVMKWPQPAPALVKLEKMGIAVQWRPHYSSRLLTRLARRIRYALWDRTVEKSLAAFRPDVICISQGGNFDLADLADLRRYLLSARIPYCLICHNYDASRLPPSYVRQAVAEAYAEAARVYFVSNEQAMVSLRQLARTFDNIEVVQNPVNIAEPQLLPWPPASPAQLAIVGGLHIDFKGQDLALEVLGQPAWQQRDWYLNLYGEGYDREYIEKLIVLYGLADRVKMHGYCADVQSIWRNNHLLLMPSRREAAPLVVMEAMLSGRPVVATSIGTIPEWVQPGITGFVAAAATGPLFGEALEQAWQARAEWPAIGRQAFVWASNYIQANPAQAMLARLVAIGQKAY